MTVVTRHPPSTIVNPLLTWVTNELNDPKRRPIFLTSLLVTVTILLALVNSALQPPAAPTLPPSSALRHASAPVAVSTSTTLGLPSSFLDQNYIQYAGEASQFETLFPPSEIDFSITRRLAYEESSKCDDVLVFMPYEFARHGHGSQLNNYLLAVMIATFLGKAMVILEIPPDQSVIPNGSQFGCPIDGFQDVQAFFEKIEQGRQHKYLEMKEDFPVGLSRLIQHPDWLSRKCPIPCQSTMTSYQEWDDVRKMKVSKNPKITCTSDNGRETNVLLLGGDEGRKYFLRQFKPRMLARDPSERDVYVPGLAYNWALRLGARAHEAQVFSELRQEQDIWDYVSALMARSGLIRFQPWIVRDVMEFIKNSELPLNESYDAIHVRRGDKLELEAVPEVTSYWLSQGYEEGDRFPTNYVPFSQYLKQFENHEDCPIGFGNGNGEVDIRTVYISTDDAETVKQEIAKLPQGRGGAYIIGGCHNVRFIFNPAVDETSQFHLSEGGAIGDCFERYTRNIQAIADMMINVRSETFVGEFNSNWGRFVRIFRMYFNDGLHAAFSADGGTGGSRRTGVVVKDFRVAFGDLIPDPPGW